MTDEFFGNMEAERQRQILKWGKWIDVEEWHSSYWLPGEQDLERFPYPAGHYSKRMTEAYRGEPDKLKNVNKVIHDLGYTFGWDTIFLEEVYEALAESDPAKRMVELEQVATLAWAMWTFAKMELDRTVPEEVGSYP